MFGKMNNSEEEVKILSIIDYTVVRSKHVLFLRPFVLFFFGAVATLFTPKIASYYEEFYESKGVKFIKGTVLTSFDFSTDGKVKSFCICCYKIYNMINFSFTASKHSNSGQHSH